MVTLAQAKAHCRIEYDEDDAAIEAMIAAASGHLESIGVDMTTPLPPPVSQAVLMLVGHFFMNREAVTRVEVVATQIGVDRLIQPFREVSL